MSAANEALILNRPVTDFMTRAEFIRLVMKITGDPAIFWLPDVSETTTSAGGVGISFAEWGALRG
jgi:hypothetical protein|tara:strand:- start:7264 stop:7458 length:195 start_codon:yes stop_codon:yes gene_type:complete